jgi:hypothetical protein
MSLLLRLVGHQVIRDVRGCGLMAATASGREITTSTSTCRFGLIFAAIYLMLRAHASTEQMQYWAAESAQMSEIVQPLADFIHRLQTSGRKTAKLMYGSRRGWVAHGFTDGFLDAGLAGDPHWSLCVSW